MTTISDLKTQIANANALGRTNLAEKGVELLVSATTYDIMQSIADVSSGGGVSYTSIVYNNDGTITLVDKDGIVHTMECGYNGKNLTSVKYDEKTIELVYNGEHLVNVGATNIDLKEIKALYNKEIEATLANQLIFEWSTRERIYKANDGVCLCGIYNASYNNGTFLNPVVVAKTREAALFLHAGKYESRILEFEYDKETYYAAIYGLTINVSYVSEAGAPRPKFLSSTSARNAATELLDYYFGNAKDFQNGFALGLASGVSGEG